MAAEFLLSADRDKLRYRRALRQIRFDLEGSAVPHTVRERIYKLIDDALAGDAKSNPTKRAHR